MSNVNTSNAAQGIINLAKVVMGNAAFDTTIRAIVQEKVDNVTGKFKLQYQDSVFYAFADDIKTNYTKGTEVFVLVPQNDFTQDKRIIGSVKTLGEDYVGVFTYDERYKIIGNSAFGEYDANGDGQTDWFELKSKDLNESTPSLTLYSSQNANSQLTYNPDILNYLKNGKVNGLWLEGTFKTYLNQVQDFNSANYGLRLTFSVGKGEESPTQQHTVQLDANSMEGNPFNLSGNRQVIVFSGIDWSTVQSIISLEFFAEGFTIDSIDEDLFVKDIKMYAVSYISDEELNVPGLHINAPQGLYINSKRSINEITLKAELKIDGKVQSSDVAYYWFIEDPAVTNTSNIIYDEDGKYLGSDNVKVVYNPAGGAGWKNLTDFNIVEKESPSQSNETETITTHIIEWNGSSNSYKFNTNNVDSASVRVKCVARYKDTFYEDIVTIYDKDQTEYFTLEADKLYFSNIDKKIKLRLIKKIEPAEEYNIKWFRQGIYDSQPVEIEELRDKDIYQEEGKNIVNSATYMVIINWEENGVNKTYTTNSITLSMKTDEQEETPQFSLSIINGDQVFKYNEDGISPISEAVVSRSPQIIHPLSFVLFSNYDGEEIEEYESFEWDCPEEDTLLINGQSTENGYSFSIKPTYNRNYSNNQITLKVGYNGAIFTAKTNFTFLKEGDPGTNGTNVAIVIKKEGSNTATVYKYVNGIKEEFEGDLTYHWSGETVTNDTNSKTATIKGESEQGIIKCTIKKGNEILYYGYYVLPFVENKNKPERISFSNFFPYIIYDASGDNPKYSRLEVQGLQEGQEVVYKVGISGDYVSYSALIPKQYNSSLASTEGVIKVTAYLKKEEAYTEIAKFTLLASLNRHAFSMVNSWDGNLKIDDGNNYILSATVAAGKKDDNNTFTGVMIGTVGDNTSTNSNNNRTGFFGFYQGAQTAFIDADDGSTRLGNSEKTLFQIGNKYSEEFLRSSNYVEGSKVTTVTLRESSTGVSTTYPSAQWGNNNITIVYAESTHVTPIGAIKGTGYSISFSEPTNVQYIKGYLGNSSVEKYFYVTAATTTATLYKDSNFSYQLNSSIGMKIDLKNGSIFAPGYYLDGASGNATFSGEVTATSGHFSQGVTLGNSNISVGAMLNSLSSAVSNVNYAIAELSSKITKTEAESYINSTVQTEVDKIEIPTLPKYIEETKITSTTIESPIITGGTIIGGTFQAKVNEATGIKDVFTMSFINNNGNYYARLASGWAPMMITTTFGQIILTTGSSIKLDASGGVYLGDQKIQVEQ